MNTLDCIVVSSDSSYACSLNNHLVIEKTALPLEASYSTHSLTEQHVSKPCYSNFIPLSGPNPTPTEVNRKAPIGLNGIESDDL